MEAAVVAGDIEVGTEDADLVAASMAGDEQAFRALYERHVGAVYSFLRWTTRSVAEAEELTQDVFVRAWEKLGHYQGRGRLSTWLIGIAINAGRERRRSLARANRGRVECLDPSEYATVDEPRREDLMDLERAIRRLPARAGRVLVLAEIGGYRHAEIAALMGTSVGTSKAQLHRAKRLLRREVEP